MKISTIIPAYDEKGNAEVLAKRLHDTFKKLKIPFEIIFIVQGTDGTYEALKKLPKTYNLKLFYFRQPMGIGKPYKLGFNHIAKDTTHLVMMDSDLNHQPEELEKFIAAMKKTNADIVIGSRFIKGGVIEGMPAWKRKLSKLTNFVVSLLFGLTVNDKTSGYRLCKRKVVDTIKDEITAKNFEYYPQFLIKASKHKFSMTEVPIIFKFRVTGESKLKVMKNLPGYISLLKERF